MDIGLWYPKGDNFELIGYSDGDFAGCKVERKNTRVHKQTLIFLKLLFYGSK